MEAKIGTVRALEIIAGRYSEAQLLKAQDIVRDLADELRGFGSTLTAVECDRVFDLLARAVNIQ